jgi:hypothetical protein
MTAIVAGTVEIEEGCIWLSDSGGSRYPVVWPFGTSASSDPPVVTLRDGQEVRPGDAVAGAGGYIDANHATTGLDPFPPECVQVGEAAVFNADSPIDVTVQVGLDVVETLVARLSLPMPIGLELIAINANDRTVAIVEFVEGTVHLYQPDQYQAAPDAIDGASGGGGFIHLWSQGTVYSYPGRIDDEPLVYQPQTLREVPGIASTLQVMPAPDGEHTWLVQSGSADEPTLVELINLVGVQVALLAEVNVEGVWRPVGATVDGLVLVGEGPNPSTGLVGFDGAVVELPGTAISVGWNGVVLLTGDGSLAITDSLLGDPVQVAPPDDGAWQSIGGPIAPSTAPPVRTGTAQFLVLRADEPNKGAISSGELFVVTASGVTTPIYDAAEGVKLATWSRGEDWVVVVEGSSVTLVSIADLSAVPLGDIVPEGHWVLTAG